MIKIAICDDEQMILDQVTQLTSVLLEKAQITYKIHTFLSGEDLIQSLKDNAEYDIALLDIKLKKLSGIDVAARLREQFQHYKTILIYISAYDSRCKETLYFNTLRFLSKPIDPSLFEEALCSACKKIKSQEKKFSFKDVETGHTELRVDDILYFETREAHRINIVTSFRKYVYYGSIADAETQLELFDFLRIHRSYLVNFDNIKKITFTEVTMQNEKNLPIARMKRKDISRQYWSIRKKRAAL